MRTNVNYWDVNFGLALKKARHVHPIPSQRKIKKAKNFNAHAWFGKHYHVIAVSTPL